MAEAVLPPEEKENELRQTLVNAACEHAKSTGSSSLHVLFPQDDELVILENGGLKLRKDCQFHWHNRNYRSFDEFLQTFNTSKRKKVRRDRRHVKEQGFPRTMTDHARKIV